MSECPLVSCLMPTKNRRKFIPRALKMWREQDYPNKELIVIEDGDDNVHDLILDARETNPRIRYRSFTGTLGAKLNYGAGRAYGQILLNYDDDDFQAPKRISLQVQHMQMTGKPFVAFSSLIYYREGQDYGREYTGNAWYATGSTHCYTREWAMAHPRPDMTVGEDEIAVAEARANRALSTISGTRCLVACTHDSNCSARSNKATGDCESLSEFLRSEEALDASDNFQRIPLSEFIDTVNAGRI